MMMVVVVVITTLMYQTSVTCPAQRTRHLPYAQGVSRYLYLIPISHHFWQTLFSSSCINIVKPRVRKQTHIRKLRFRFRSSQCQCLLLLTADILPQVIQLIWKKERMLGYGFVGNLAWGQNRKGLRRPRSGMGI